MYYEYENCAKILGISPKSNIKDIKAAYKKLVLQFHPDRIQNLAEKENAEEKFKQINYAYHYLLDNYLIVGYGFRTGNFYAKSDYAKETFRNRRQENTYYQNGRVRRQSRYFFDEEENESCGAQSSVGNRKMPEEMKVFVMIFFNILSLLLSFLVL